MSTLTYQLKGRENAHAILDEFTRASSSKNNGFTLVRSNFEVETGCFFATLDVRNQKKVEQWLAHLSAQLVAHIDVAWADDWALGEYCHIYSLVGGEREEFWSGLGATHLPSVAMASLIATGMTAYELYQDEDNEGRSRVDAPAYYDDINDPILSEKIDYWEWV